MDGNALSLVEMFKTVVCYEYDLYTRTFC